MQCFNFQYSEEKKTIHKYKYQILRDYMTDEIVLVTKEFI